ncbi:hypothetical protein [Kitasatospora sp. NPDC059327]|uniref:glycosyl hydrolase family 95 catalytic domain-containing protein n=1 Tax=Kitasatospora sp. NPDC059327 TaxID=3346803 RepID=UPI00368AA911
MHRRRTAVATRAVTAAAALATVIALGPTAVPAGAHAGTTSYASTADRASEWADLSQRLDRLAGVHSSPPSDVQTDGYTTGSLLGNGNLGVAVGGSEHRQSLYFGRNDFWSSKSPGNNTPITIGGLTVRTPYDRGDEGTAFEQTQDIRRGEVRSSISISARPVTVTSWVADSEDTVVTQVRTTSTDSVPVLAEVWGRGDNPDHPAAAGTTGDTAWATRQTASTPDSLWVNRVGVATRVLGASATPAVSAPNTSTLTFSVTASEPVTLVTAIRGGRNSTSHLRQARGAAARATPARVATLDAARQDWWKNYWLRSHVEVFQPDGGEDLTLMRYYYGSLYALGAASRAGSVAPGLYGPWITTDTPLWHGDYHLNYNFQAPYYGAFSGNRGDTAEPAVRAVLDYRPTALRDLAALPSRPAGGAAFSQQFKDALGTTTKGLLYPVNIGPWGVTSGSSDTDQGGWYGNQTIDASFAAVPLIATYEYGQDRAYLASHLYPFLKQVGDFWISYLGPKAADGRYHAMGAAHEEDWAKDDTLTLGAIRMVLSALTRYSLTLDQDPGPRGTWQDILDHLPPPPTATYRGRTVYNRDYTNTDFGPLVGRTIVALEWIDPLGAQHDPRTAIDTLDAYDSWGQGNNFPKSFPLAAKLGYPAQRLHDLFVQQISNRMRPNLTVHSDGGGLETVGAIETLHAMLARREADTITYFPHWIPGRPASFTDLRVPGGFLLSARTDGTTPSRLRLTSEQSGTAQVTNPWPGRTVTVTDGSGAPVPVTFDGPTLAFPTTAGHAYRLAATRAGEIQEVGGDRGVEATDADAGPPRLASRDLARWWTRPGDGTVRAPGSRPAVREGAGSAGTPVRLSNRAPGVPAQRRSYDPATRQS